MVFITFGSLAGKYIQYFMTSFDKALLAQINGGHAFPLLLIPKWIRAYT
jgi:hypothetical protein